MTSQGAHRAIGSQETVYHSTVLDEDFVVSLFPMREPAAAGEMVSYCPVELHELARFQPTATELRALHEAKRLFGGVLVKPIVGEITYGVAA